MALASTAYISTSSLGNQAQCTQQLAALRKQLAGLRAKKRLRGYLCRVFASHNDLLDEELDPGPVEDACGKRFPCLWLVVSYSGRSVPSDVRALVSTYSLKELT